MTVRTKRWLAVGAKAILFTAIVVFLLLFLGNSFQPVWEKWSAYNSYACFYEEPANTIDAIILGPSTGVNGVIPIEMYEHYGISAYNLCGGSQPLLVSYYWLKEVYRLHPETLTTVLLETSSMVEKTLVSYYQKGIDLMQLSPVKIEAVHAYTDGISDFFLHLFPTLEYHDRWETMTEDEWLQKKPALVKYLRGYNFDDSVYMTASRIPEEMTVPYFYINEKAKKTHIKSESEEYAKKIVAFCAEHHLNLVLFSSPTNRKRDSGFNNAIQAFADENSLPYLNFAFEPLQSELAYQPAVDSMDHTHLNYHGAVKLTSWLGQHLRDKYNLPDHRGDSRYAFLEEELADYRNLLYEGEFLADQLTAEDYLYEALGGQPYSVYISVMDDAAGALTDAQREAFRELGLEKLSVLKRHERYLAVLREGELVVELSSADQGESSLFWKDGDVEIRSDEGLSSILIHGEETARNKKGLNIVVWDEENNRLIDSSYFKTGSASWQPGDNLSLALDYALQLGVSYQEMPEKLQKLYRYSRLMEHARMQEAWKYFGKNKEKNFRQLAEGLTGYEVQTEETENGTACVIYDIILNRIAVEAMIEAK